MNNEENVVWNELKVKIKSQLVLLKKDYEDLFCSIEQGLLLNDNIYLEEDMIVLNEEMEKIINYQ